MSIPAKATCRIRIRDKVQALGHTLKAFGKGKVRCTKCQVEVAKSRMAHWIANLHADECRGWRLVRHGKVCFAKEWKTIAAHFQSKGGGQASCSTARAARSCLDEEFDGNGFDEDEDDQIGLEFAGFPEAEGGEEEGSAARDHEAWRRFPSVPTRGDGG